MNTTDTPVPARNPQTECKLFSIPAEIRNHIYYLVLTVKPEDSCRVSLTSIPAHSEQPTVLSILQTCRLVTDEAQAIFYNTNHIVLRERYDMPIADFVRRTSLKRLSGIRNLTVIMSADLEPAAAICRVLHRLDGLTALLIHIEHGFDDALGSEWILRNLKREWQFLISAARRLPSTLTEVKITMTPFSRPSFRPLAGPGKLYQAISKLELGMLQASKLRKTGVPFESAGETTAAAGSSVL